MARTAKQTRALPEYDIAVGQTIPGSKYLRDYCQMCGCRMRVTDERLGHSQCSDCDTHVVRDRRVGVAPRDEDAFGYQSVAIRAMEDNE